MMKRTRVKRVRSPLLVEGLNLGILVLVALWALIMISLPIMRWTLGDAALQRGIVIGVLVQVVEVLAILGHSWGVRSTLRVGATVCLLALMVEALGSNTGVPFGHYTYTAALQPQVLGVPLLVPLAWLMMLPPAWAVGWQMVSGGETGKNRTAYSLKDRLIWAAASALAFTAWDLFLDPQMVAWDFWVWDAVQGCFGCSYFGVPWANYLGWLCVSLLISLAASFFFQPWRLPVAPLLLIYTITWLLQTIGQVFFWDLPGPGLAGFLGMGIVLAFVFFKRRNNV